MKKPLIVLLVKVAAVFLITLLCHLTYITCNLQSLFRVEVSYLQWLGITIISTLLFHKPTEPIQNDSERPQVSQDLP